MNGRYFEGDFPELTRRLEEHFDRVRASWEAHGWKGSLVLGGGYGRGEGGVMISSPTPAFSNDLDYFLFHEKPASPELIKWAREIERVESALLDIDVEIKAMKPLGIHDPTGSMMFSDLVAGHIPVAGDASFLKEMAGALDFSKIGSTEATRLLWNRGSGLFFSRCRIPDQREMGFVIRNHAKVKLALGDSWLCLNGLYTPQCRERGRRLSVSQLPDSLSWLVRWHEEGVDFKFRPFADGITWEELAKESHTLIKAWGEVFLLAESARLGTSFPNFASYLSASRLMPEHPLFKNLGLSARDRLKRGACLRPLGDYPRASLMRALPCLLGLTAGGVKETTRFLPASSGEVTDPRSWEETYARWWAYYA